MIPILTADSITKSFGERRVLSSATLRAVPGELRVMFGRNGIGKSTLLKIAAGILPPDNGVIHFKGAAYESSRLWRMARNGLFYLPDHDLLSDSFSISHQLEMFRAQFHGTLVREALDAVGLNDHGDKRPSQLSGGERRRAELAAVLVRRPTCLLADEPFRGIAPNDAEDLISVFRRLAKDGAAVVITGHEVATLLDAADHVSWCTAGTTYELGTPASATANERFRQDYLGSWYRSPVST